MSGRKAAFKVARKNAVRNRKRTIFLVLLVAVPVAFGVVVGGVVRASSLTREEQAQTFFGASDVRIDLVDAGELFSADTELLDWIRSNMASLDPESTITEFHQAGISVPGVGYAQVSDLNLHDPAAAGYLISLDGRTPTGPGEVSISPRLAEKLEVNIGDIVEIENLPLGALEVVGYVSQPFYSASSDLLVQPGGLEPLLHDPLNPASPILFVSGPNAEQAGTRLQELWYSGGQELFWPEPAVDSLPAEVAFLAEDQTLFLLLTEAEINELADMVNSFDGTEQDPQGMVWNEAWQMIYGSGFSYRGLPDLQVQTRAQWLSWRSFEETPGIVSTGAAALLLVEVAFITGAAFAAGTRRRLREIGLMGANGASRSHVKSTVLGEGLAIGTVGALAGVVLGVGVLVLARPLLQRFITRVMVGLGVSLMDVVGPVVIAIISVLLAVAIPARTASKVPTTTALQGRMPALAPRKWIIPVGAGAAAAGFLLISVSLVSNSNYAGFLVGVGAVMVVGGIAMLSSPILAGVTKLSDHVPATTRLVLRDSGRNRTRAAVAVAAIMVILLAPITAMTTAATTAEKNLVYGLPSPSDHLLLTGSYANVNFGNPVPITENDIAALAAVIPEKRSAVFETYDLTILTNELLDAEGSADDQFGVIQQQFTDGNAVAAGSEDLLLALDHPGVTASIGKGEIVVLGIEDKSTRVEIDGVEYPAHEYPVPVVQWAMPRVLLPDSIVADFPEAETQRIVLFVLDRNLTDDEWQSIAGLALVTQGGNVGVSESAAYLILGGATLLVVLIVVALVTAVSAAEVDQEIRTIVAVGAPGTIRRRFLSLLTGYQTLIAMALAVPLGLGLVWVFSSANEYIQAGPFGLVNSSTVTVPWIWILGFAITLPVIIGLLTLISVRSAPVTPPRRAT
jgi:hypothetical protein